MNEANWNIEPHSADFWRVSALGAVDSTPPGAGIVVDGPIPYLPAAAAKRKENFTNRLTLDPEIKCYLPGVPRAMYQNMPFQIIQGPEFIAMAFQFAGGLRTVYMKPTPGPADSWMGWSNGRWECETLVIETTGTEDKIDSLLEVLRPYGVIEMVRTGRVEMARGTTQAVAVSPSSICL